LRRPSLTRWQHATLESALDGRTHPALRRRDTRTGAPGKAPGLQTPPRMVPRQSPQTGRAGLALEPGRPWSPASAVLAARTPHEASLDANAGRDRVPLPLRRARTLPGPRALALRVPARRHGAFRPLPAGRIRQRVVRGQLELARADLVSGQFPHH